MGTAIWVKCSIYTTSEAWAWYPKLWKVWWGLFSTIYFFLLIILSPFFSLFCLCDISVNILIYRCHLLAKLLQSLALGERYIYIHFICFLRSTFNQVLPFLLSYIYADDLIKRCKFSWLYIQEYWDRWWTQYSWHGLVTFFSFEQISRSWLYITRLIIELYLHSGIEAEE